MTCAGVQRLLSAYIDGELDAASRRAVDEHLQGCEPCRHDLASLTKTVNMIHALGQIHCDSSPKPAKTAKERST